MPTRVNNSDDVTTSQRSIGITSLTREVKYIAFLINVRRCMLDFVIKYRRVSIPERDIVIQYRASNYRDLPVHRRNRHNSSNYIM